MIDLDDLDKLDEMHKAATDLPYGTKSSDWMCWIARFVNVIFTSHVLYKYPEMAAELRRLREVVEINNIFKHAENLEVENEKLRAENAKMREQMQNTLNLLRTGSPPDAWGVTKKEWNTYKINTAAGELSRAQERELEPPSEPSPYDIRGMAKVLKQDKGD